MVKMLRHVQQTASFTTVLYMTGCFAQLHGQAEHGAEIRAELGLEPSP